VAMGVIRSFCACAGNASPATNVSPATAKRKWIDPAKALFVQRFAIFLTSVFLQFVQRDRSKSFCPTDREVSRIKENGNFSIDLHRSFLTCFEDAFECRLGGFRVEQSKATMAAERKEVIAAEVLIALETGRHVQRLILEG